MNSLGRDIQNGEQVILSATYYPGDEHARTLIADGGFGMQYSTIGTGVYGTWLDGAGQDKVCGREIDRDATVALAARLANQRAAETARQVRANPRPVRRRRTLHPTPDLNPPTPPQVG